MSNEQRVTLSKACNQCIQAKRKCSRSLPKCQRCSERRVPCKYKNTPLDGKIIPPGVVFLAPTSRSGSSQDDDNPIDSPFFRALSKTPRNSCSSHYTLPRLSTAHILQPDIILAMDAPTVSYLLDHFRSFPLLLVQTGGVPFIHPQLYQDGYLPYLQNILALCNLYVHINTSHLDILPSAISYSIKVLLSSRPTVHTFKSKLAFVQSLILLQIITLFSPFPPITTTFRQQAENRVQLLKSLVEDLYVSTPASLPSSMPPYQAWILAESCRRTIHVGRMIQGVYLMLTRGSFNLTMFVKALPLCKNVGLWELNSSAYNMQCNTTRDGGSKVGLLAADLISYRELTDMWDNDEVKQLHLFEEMLIAACKGLDDVKAKFLNYHPPST
jgi:hypothetical protein